METARTSSGKQKWFRNAPSFEDITDMSIIGIRLGDTLPDKDSVSIDTLLDNQKVRDAIVESLKSLSMREEMVLRLRFGIDDVSENDENIYEI